MTDQAGMVVRRVILIEFGSDALIFHKVMAFGLRKKHELSVLRTFIRVRFTF
jgi:hypothetical protein